jgi:hypothetical protein
MTIRSASRPSIVAMLLVFSVSSLVACTKDLEKQLTQPESAVYAVPVREVRPGEVGVLRFGRSRPALDRHRGRPRTRRDRGPQLPGRAGVPLVGRPDRRFHAGREVVPRIARVERGHRADPRWQGAVLDQ